MGRQYDRDATSSATDHNFDSDSVAPDGPRQPTDTWYEKNVRLGSNTLDERPLLNQVTHLYLWVIAPARNRLSYSDPRDEEDTVKRHSLTAKVRSIRYAGNIVIMSIAQAYYIDHS